MFKYFVYQWLPESARYDITRGHTEKALATLERIAKDNGKPMPLGKLVEPSTKVINYHFKIIITLHNESLNSDSQQFHQYKKKQTFHLKKCMHFDFFLTYT